jgi:hypothetical protein
MSELTDLIKHPTFDVKLPLSGKSVRFRPWTIKEEKKLLIAKESTNVIDKLDSICEVVSLCSNTTENLPIIDTEFLFYHIRMQSVGAEIPLVFNKKYTASADLSKMKVIYPENHTNKIKINDSLGIVMKYPTYETTKRILQSQEQNEDIITFEIIKDCIEYVATPKTQLLFSSYPESDQEEFFNNLSHDSVEKLTEFFDTMPYIQLIVKYETEDEVKEYEVRTLANFFT